MKKFLAGMTSRCCCAWCWWGYCCGNPRQPGADTADGGQHRRWGSGTPPAGRSPEPDGDQGAASGPLGGLCRHRRDGTDHVSDGTQDFRIYGSRTGYRMCTGPDRRPGPCFPLYRLPLSGGGNPGGFFPGPSM